MSNKFSETLSAMNNTASQTDNKPNTETKKPNVSKEINTRKVQLDKKSNEAPIKHIKQSKTKHSNNNDSDMPSFIYKGAPVNKMLYNVQLPVGLIADITILQDMYQLKNKGQALELLMNKRDSLADLIRKAPKSKFVPISNQKLFKAKYYRYLSTRTDSVEKRYDYYHKNK